METHIETKEQVQSVPTPCTTYAMFYNSTVLEIREELMYEHII